MDFSILIYKFTLRVFLIFVKNLPFNSNFEIYILYLGRDCLYEFVILKNVKKIGGIHYTLRN